MSNPLADMQKPEVIFCIGTNMTECHPVAATGIKKAIAKGSKLIVADPRRIGLADLSHLYLPLRVGSDVALLLAMAHVIQREGLANNDFIETRTKGIQDFLNHIEDFTPEWAATITGLNPKDIETAAILYASANRSAIYYTLGITEHICGVDNVQSLSNLALMTGHIGKEGTGLNPMRGQNNIQGAGDSEPITITVTVTPLPDPPVANDLSIETKEDTETSFTLTATDVDGDAITAFEVLNDPAFGVVSGVAPQLTYKPKKDYSGQVTFKFRVKDATDLFSLEGKEGTVTIKISAVNDAPVAKAQSVSVDEDRSVLISLKALDIEGNPLDYGLESQPSHGTLSQLSGRTVTYTPAAEFNGSDSFTFSVKEKESVEGNLGGNVETVSITVNAINDVPVAKSQEVTTKEDTAKSIVLAGTDIENSTLTYVVDSQPSNGVLTGTAPDLTYTPNANYHGTDSFSFKVNDGTVDSGIEVVNLTIDPQPDIPVSESLSLAVVSGKPKTIYLKATDADGDTLTYALVDQPSHGNTELNGSVVTYTSTTDYVGEDSFSYTSNDGSTASNLATVNLAVVSNQPPDIANMNWSPKPSSVSEDQQLSITLTAVDTPTDGVTDAIAHYQIVVPPINGRISGVDNQLRTTSGIISYVPNLNYPGTNDTGTDSFAFVANDGTSDSEPLTVTITVNQVADDPLANPIFATVTEDSADNTITLTGTDPDGDAISSFQILSPPSSGNLAGDGANITYTPEANFPHANYARTDTFAYSVTDSTGRSSQAAAVTVTVKPVNDTPVTTDLPSTYVAVQRSANNPVTMLASDPDNDQLIFTIVTTPSSGQIRVSNNIAYYTPDPSFNGADTFSFKVSDGLVESNTSTAKIQVDSIKEEVVDAAKLATEGQTAEVHLEEGKVELTLPPASDPSIGKVAVGIAKSNFTEMTSAASEAEKEVAAREIINQLKTDFADELGTVATGSQVEEKIKGHLKRAQGAMLKIEVKTQSGGKKRDFSQKPLQIRVPRRGAATAIVLADGNGSELIPTQVEGDILIGTVKHLSLVFTVANNQPTAEDKVLALTEDSNANVTLAGADADNDLITYTIVGAPSKGRLTGTAPNLTYVPYSNLNGNDSFTYVTNDGASDSTLARVTITINAINDSPSAASQTVTTEEDKSVSITLTGSDVDGNAITYSIVGQPTQGTLTGSGKNQTYTPNANYNGNDSFTFRTNDGSVSSSLATVTIKVTSVNDVPELTTIGNISLGEDADNQTIELAARDLDGDTLTYSTTNSNTDLVTASVVENKLTLDLQPDQNGSASLIVKVEDPNGGSDSQTFTLTVSSVNDAPVAQAASLEAIEDQSLEITLVATDVDSQDLTYSLVSTASNGELSTITDGKLTYKPNLNYHGTDSFTFQAKDEKLVSETKTIDIIVTAVNDLPMASSQSGEHRVEFTSLTAEIVLSGEDVDGDTLSYVLVDLPKHGQLSGEAPNLTYTPGASFTGADQFTFKVNDGTADSEIATVDLLRPFLPFKFEVPSGISLIHLPLKVKFINGQPQEINTVADLYEVLGSGNVNFLITYDKETSSWSSYLGPKNRGFRADQTITPDLGIIAVMKKSTVLDILGDPLLDEGVAKIQLQRGLNLIGVPVKDERITNAGDLLALPGFADNVTSMIIPSEGSFKVLARAGDAGDFELTGAESIIVTAKAETVVSLTGAGWSRVDTGQPVLVAPSIVSQSEGFTPVLATSGQVIAESMEFQTDKTQVWVQNLNNGYSLSQSITDSSFQLTLVDTDSDGVARVGDLLEVGGETGQSRFRIKPYQHQVTSQDIKQGWIQLPDLVAREIPAETQLLPNYPNPFNPETWIPFDLAEDASVEISIYGGQGELVRTLMLGHVDAGIYRHQGKAAYWDGRNANGELIASGVYFYRIQAGDYNQIRKMVILK